MTAANASLNENLPHFDLVQSAPAKINLALHVIGQRADGHHLLESIVTFADRGDRVGLSATDEDRFTVSGSFACDIPADGPAASGNLVLKARNSLRALLLQRGLPARPMHLHLEKNLPVASGIGGGSADAAATLRGLLALWAVPPFVDDRFSDDLAAVALQLGADVPMCFHGKPLMARGVGERTEALAAFPAFPMLLVNPRVPVSTPVIFRTLTNKANPSLVLPHHTVAAADWIGALAAMRNDLEPPAQALAPVIGDVSQALSETGARLARMSGSGATCFGLFSDEHARDRAAEMLCADHPDWYVLRCFSIGGDHHDTA
ncbi:4-diphosphocytidyl-2-C-methyl-D-erythritol kinase [Pararhizobium capsulatum DSM 1112]|uniref:4-diphosphocytidyl-2-C-methyl-D-erythritol kinase n=1 Tax=Pararhizobium capsulatum DSM 1112 TaxID=1121113 RepID=A0ABU0BM91_9HYPH|nr:4-(cytidine 5'-diphospho)-2-C-methyl-D-erythritol kinase [Pararhizobium capsulatum]MDQ0319363.1 4-diphosphocytidyl-2-C-methyl-D-erythritol kinase [Pararhizobium capsulatum DSM 1112]